MAEYVTPFDIPTRDGAPVLKLDLYENRAAFEMTNSRKELVNCLQAASERYGWKVSEADKFVTGDAHMLPIHVDSGAYLVARLVESKGVYSGSIEFYAKAPKSAEPPDTVVDATPTTAAPIATKDTSFEDLNAQVNSAVQAELAKALGSIGSAPAAGPTNLADLQAKAASLQAMLSKSDDASSGDLVESEVPTENPFDIPEDSTAPSAEIRNIKKAIGKFKYEGETYNLPYVACYSIKEYGEPTKCILFSDSPIDVQKLKRLLLEEGHAVHGMHVAEKAKNMIDLRVSPNSVSLNAQIGSLSLGISTSKIQADVTYYQGKIAGKISSTEPIDVGRSALELEMTLNEPAIQVDWSKRQSP